MNLKESKTFSYLARAFAGECQAETRYRFMQYAAEKEGYPALADLISDIIRQEFNHARMLYSFIQTASSAPIDDIEIRTGYPFKEKWNLVDNLKIASENEMSEATKIYPSYAATASEEGFFDISGLFLNLAKVETCHKKIFEQLYTKFRNGSVYKSSVPIKWKCSRCGHEQTLLEAWEECPLCHAPQGAVEISLE